MLNSQNVVGKENNSGCFGQELRLRCRSASRGSVCLCLARTLAGFEQYLMEWVKHERSQCSVANIGFASAGKPYQANNACEKC